ncbi:prolactin-8A9-like [Mastomys coucha]|uniref:prolactin-8A9-like n=1 Tax=Mastomys coucha TaxID=35658 RepID=UPI0012618DBC|nr:prolactin-8A9-like [Mastomys coucha]
MKTKLIQPHFCTFLLLVVSNLLLWEKTASISVCRTEEEGCMKPLLETFNSAMQRAETILNLTEQMHQEYLHNEFSSKHFAVFNSQLIRQDQLVLRARTYCHSNITNPPITGPEYINIRTKKYLKMLINFVGAWMSPLYHLAIELSAMQDVPETILSKANEIEENNRELLNDLMWILNKAYPTAKMKKVFPSWEHLSSMKSTDKNHQFLAIFNLSHCLRVDIFYTKYHLRTLKCRITGKDC